MFRVLANTNRLRIIELLNNTPSMNVGEIAGHLKISFKATSNHLAILKNLDVLEARGVTGHVFYSLNQKSPKDFQRVITLFLKFSLKQF